MEQNKQRTLTCIVCPRGCMLTVELKGREVVSVAGNICPRGKQYAIDECTHPMRTVTSTVRTSDGRMLPVKTSTTIPKEHMHACMEAINRAVATLPVRVGDVIVKDVFGADVVATEEMK